MRAVTVGRGFGSIICRSDGEVGIDLGRNLQGARAGWSL